MANTIARNLSAMTKGQSCCPCLCLSHSLLLPPVDHVVTRLLRAEQKTLPGLLGMQLGWLRWQRRVLCTCKVFVIVCETC